MDKTRLKFCPSLVHEWTDNIEPKFVLIFQLPSAVAILAGHKVSFAIVCWNCGYIVYVFM